VGVARCVAAGPATVDAFLGALDAFEGDLEATDTATVTLDAASVRPAVMWIAWRGDLDEPGEASLVVWARCQPPWAVAGLSVELTQGDDSGVGNTDRVRPQADVGERLRNACRLQSVVTEGRSGSTNPRLGSSVTSTFPLTSRRYEARPSQLSSAGIDAAWGYVD
jgi:hypothetical protein